MTTPQIVFSYDISATRKDHVKADLLRITDNDFQLLIRGKGKMKDWDWFNAKDFHREDVILHTKKIVIENGIKNIGQCAFKDFVYVKEVWLPVSVQKISHHSFNGCTSLQLITLPRNLDSFGDFVFAGCHSLQYIHVHPDNIFFCSEDGVLFSKDKKVLLSYPGMKGPTYFIPKGTDRITSGAFRGCTGLACVHVPATVKTLHENTFLRCDNLLYLVIHHPPNAVPLEPWGAPNVKILYIPEK